MYLKRVFPENQLFDDAFRLYQSAFPREERRDVDEHLRVMKKDDYHFDLIMDGDSFVGVMLYWETDDFIYLEHFTTRPELRGKGKGAEALKLLKAKGKTVILEIEDPVDEITKRRYGFYLRNGFTMTSHYHIQAKYHLGDEDLMLKILSYPKEISKEEYLSFQDYMTKQIGILPNFSNEVTIRPMEVSDSVEQVARLIYESDAYIYPNWFKSIDDGVKVLSKMIDMPTLYNRKNITVAVSKEGKVVGALVSCYSPVLEEKAHIYEAFKRAEVEVSLNTDEIYESYYEKMALDTEGYYLANIAVDESFRGKGVGATLLAKVIEDKNYCHLECVKENISAWRIYQRLGFTIVEEYPGVFAVPCYKMVKRG